MMKYQEWLDLEQEEDIKGLSKFVFGFLDLLNGH